MVIEAKIFFSLLIGGYISLLISMMNDFENNSHIPLKNVSGSGMALLFPHIAAIYFFRFYIPNQVLGMEDDIKSNYELNRLKKLPAIMKGAGTMEDIADLHMRFMEFKKAKKIYSDILSKGEGSNRIGINILLCDLLVGNVKNLRSDVIMLRDQNAVFSKNELEAISKQLLKLKEYDLVRELLKDEVSNTLSFDMRYYYLVALYKLGKIDEAAGMIESTESLLQHYAYDPIFKRLKFYNLTEKINRSKHRKSEIKT